MWEIARKISEIDHKFKKMNVEENYSGLYELISAALFFIASFSIPLTIAVYIIDGSILKAGLYFYSGLYVMMSVSSVVGFVFIVSLRLRTCNKVLEFMSHYPSNILIVTNKTGQKYDVETIGSLMEVYGKATETYELINLCYGIQTMMGFGLLFFFTIFAYFVAYRDLSTNGNLNGVTMTGLLYSLYLDAFFGAVIYISSRAEHERDNMVKLSNAIIKRSTDERKIAMLISFNSFIKRNSLKFSCGLFDFDWKLVYGVSNSNIFSIYVVNID